MQIQSRQKSITGAFFVALIVLAAGVLLWFMTGSLVVAVDTVFSALLALTAWSARSGLGLVIQQRPSPAVANPLILTGYLIIILFGLWVTVEAVLRTFTRIVDIQVSLWAPLIVILQIILKAQRANHLTKLTRATADQSLDQLAFLFNTSKWISVLTLVSLVISDVGSLIFFFDNLLRADSLVALGVSLALLLSAGRLAYLTFSNIRRAGDPEITPMLKDSVEAVAEVIRCPRLLQVFSGVFIFVDPDVESNTADSASQAQILLGEIETAIHNHLHSADISITLLPAEKTEG